tara:strand:- start:894 stop:1568 length:675 start_codon:yes stop_codon:yes gene_type:complete
MKRLLILIIVTIIIIFFQYDHINKVNNSLEILQYDNPGKQLFENIIYNKLICVFTNIPLSDNVSLNLDNLNNSNYNLLSIGDKQKFNKFIKNSFSYYNIPLCVEEHFKLNFSKNVKNKIIKQKNYRELIFQYQDSITLYIFSPNQKHLLYFNDKLNISNVDFFKQDIKKYPLITQAKYIEIKLNPGNMICIPPNWFYTYKYDTTDSISIHCISNSIFSKFLLKS